MRVVRNIPSWGVNRNGSQQKMYQSQLKIDAPEASNLPSVTRKRSRELPNKMGSLRLKATQKLRKKSARGRREREGGVGWGQIKSS